MHRKQRKEEALALLRAELAVGRSATTELTTRAAWLAWVRFAQHRFGAEPSPESDGLLVQYGTYAFTGRPMFTLDLTRQFGVNDDDGEHDHYVQVHCELRYEPEPALDAAGSFDSWYFHDTDADLDQWFAAMEKRLGLLRDRGPSEIELYEEPV
ncbi:hypothetical protein [Streptomyces sp. NBC_00347]|uniref:hypothetical protein n=1 Tax=Streptomyces sp. NBC_00347 TaxID=2975721 RepID=UPI002253B9B5|nr:hypothetical protein [Streptomyces sp. NBC_00347]MCX5129806.1 hypothetical protein [Streptomyces sp. NBC_00347]